MIASPSITTRKTRAVVEGLRKRDIQPNKCTERDAQNEGTDGVCEEGEEGGGAFTRHRSAILGGAETMQCFIPQLSFGKVL
jgi:hypothetical protein